MNDSIVHPYVIIGKKNLTIKTDDELRTQFQDDRYLWDRSTDDLYLCKWETNVENVCKMMQKIANKNGEFDSKKNNTENVTKRTMTWIY